jgi:ABC-type multidrug transport system fused ATPase/permease subunit
MHAEMEMSLNSVERVLEYTDIDQEPAAHIEETLPDPMVSFSTDLYQWPHEGKISVENMSIRYASDQPDVLHDVSFVANPHEKIAVVGKVRMSSI